MNCCMNEIVIPLCHLLAIDTLSYCYIFISFNIILLGIFIRVLDIGNRAHVDLSFKSVDKGTS